jgi:hypothetical protein
VDRLPSNQVIDIDGAPPHFVPYVVGFRASKIGTIRKVTLFWPFVRPELFFPLARAGTCRASAMSR